MEGQDLMISLVVEDLTYYSVFAHLPFFPEEKVCEVFEVFEVLLMIFLQMDADLVDSLDDYGQILAP